MPRNVYVRNTGTGAIVVMDSVTARETVTAHPSEWSLAPAEGVLDGDGDQHTAPPKGLRAPGPVGAVPVGDARRHGPNLDRWSQPGANVPDRLSYASGPIA